MTVCRRVQPLKGTTFQGDSRSSELMQLIWYLPMTPYISDTQ